MNYFNLVSTYPDPRIAAAWESQIKEANKTAWLADTLKHCGNELFGRFATRYAELSALPRSPRRALQRRIARSNELAAVSPEYLQQGGRQRLRRMAWSLAGAALLLALGQGVAQAATITVTTNDPNIISDGQCSLIEAVINANNDAANHADCLAGSGADTIVLPANANVTLTNVSDNTYGPTGLPLISSRITIEGNGAVIARQGSASAFGLMAVKYSGDLTLQSVTLSGGSSSANGGGVINRGKLTIEESTISGNTADFGGGVSSDSGTLTIENSTVSGNIASVGGGVDNVGGQLTITNSTISGNSANHGGGVYNSGHYYCSQYSFSCYFVGTLALNRSLIAGNQATVAPEIQNLGGVTANNFNLFGANANEGITGFTPGPTDIVPARGVQVADILGPLQNNGGPTQTHALVSSSPAINAGNLGGCVDSAGALLTTDQRGFPRPFNGRICDIGAYEFQADPLTIGVTTVATGEAGVSFTRDLMIFGGVPPYLVSITKGALPAGLSLGNDGIISGTISPAAKSANITVRITDSLNDSVTKTFRMTILRALSVSARARIGRVGRNYHASFRKTGGLGPFNWSISVGALPTGLLFNTATGVITGIPAQAGTFPLTVQVTDALGGVDAENLTLTIN